MCTGHPQDLLHQGPAAAAAAQQGQRPDTRPPPSNGSGSTSSSIGGSRKPDPASGRPAPATSSGKSQQLGQIRYANNARTARPRTSLREPEALSSEAAVVTYSDAQVH